MRQKRAKSYRKQMLVYNHTFKFREPYQVIVDDLIVLNTNQASFDLAKGLSRTVQAEVKPMITQCCMQALYATKNQDAISQAKDYERRRCNHPPADPKTPEECIKSIVDIKGENKHRYVVASDNETLRAALRRIPGVPMIYMNRSVMVMETLSTKSARASKKQEKAKLTSGLNAVEKPVLENGESKPKKRRGPKEPNPLSIKKRKTGETTAQTNEEQKKKRRRKHKKSADGEEISEKVEKSDEAAKSEKSDKSATVDEQSD